MRFKKLECLLYTFLILSLIPFGFVSCQRSNSDNNSLFLSDDWYVQSSLKCKKKGEEISGIGFDPEGWYPTSVPSTILATLVKNEVYKDPYYSKNLKKIPIEQFQHSWWYRKEFNLKDKKSFTNIRLVFEGINYSANIWLNGKKIASSDTIAGSFRMFEINITKFIVKDRNILAVEVFPPKPGHFTIGFVDWNPRPPDNNMGLWREVKLRISGAVSINNIFVRSKVDLETLNKASLTVSANIINHSGKEVSGIVKGEIEEIIFSQTYLLKPFENKEIEFNPGQYKTLNINNPKLWWPNNLGEPNLYQLKMIAIVNKRVSDRQKVTFGIREVSDYINGEGHRGYKVNGKKVLIRGGGWVDDLFLGDDNRRIEAQIKYTKHMNLNTIRLEGFWGSSQKLYDLADKYGILLMPGWSCHWEWEDYVGKKVDEFGGIKTPEEMDLISRSLRDQVVWLRNHPSILVWVLGSDMLPRPELEKMYNTYLAKVDPTRPTLGSCKYKVSEISGPSAVKMEGPYDYVTPNYWYVDKKRGGAYGFNTETGPGPQPPPLESIKRMIPHDHLWPIDDFWEYHCARNEFNTLKRYVKALNYRYGKPEGVEEFAMKAQVANYEAIRAMFEAFGANKHKATGVIQWMLNSAWPAMYWQLYDHYLMPGGAFYGTRKACQPVHLIYNYKDKDIYLINELNSPINNLKAEVRILNLESKNLFSKEIQVNIGENMSKKILDMPYLKGLSSVYFLDLKLKDAGEEEISNNFYWLSTKEDILDMKASNWFMTPNKDYADFSALYNLPKVKINVKHNFVVVEKNQKVNVTLKNMTDSIAFFIELRVVGEKSGQTILPVFWDDNYISLLPGEVKNITSTFANEDLKGDTPVLKFSGWNVRGN